MNVKKIAFLLLFIGLVVLGYEIKISKIWGDEGSSFSAFQFFGPLPGMFLGLWGLPVVLVGELINYILHPKELSLWTLARFLPMLFAVLYFSKGKSKLTFLSSLIGPLCILLFILHPVGSRAWYYSLYWLIPPIAYFFGDRYPLLFSKKFGSKIVGISLKALGATFTAHAVGSTAFIYLFTGAPFNTPEFWTALIPVVAVERLIFALGIAGSFLGIEYFLNTFFSEWKDLFFLPVKQPSK